MKNPLFFALVLGLMACTTPKTVLKNPKTGQVAICGGSATGSMVGGVLGYHIQKSNDTDCVADYLDQGFKKIRTEGKAHSWNERLHKKPPPGCNGGGFCFCSFETKRR